MAMASRFGSADVLLFACALILLLNVSVGQYDGTEITGCNYFASNQTLLCGDVFSKSLASIVGALPITAQHLLVTGADFSNVSRLRVETNDFRSLRSFVCHHCNISVLHGEVFEWMPDVQVIDFSWNNIINVSFSNLTDLASLKTLNLSHNAIAAIEWDQLVKLPAVEIVDLSHNNLYRLSDREIFQCFPSIESLDLSFNQIIYVHPAAFKNLPRLSSVNLMSNQLDSLQENLFFNTSISELHLSENPWHCHCGVSWLVRNLQNDSSEVRYVNKNNIECHQPDSLSRAPVHQLNDSELHCELPEFDVTPQNVTATVWHQFYLHCNATGYPTPSIFWRGPHGYLVHKSLQQYLPADIEASEKQIYNGYPRLRKSTVHALKDGGLKFTSFRFNFAGEYTCHAINPLGVAESSADVTIYSGMYRLCFTSFMVGVAASLLFLIFGVILGSVRMCSEKCCCRERNKMLYADELYDDEAEFWDEYFRHPLDSERATPVHRPSPIKCITPAEPSKHDLSDFNRGIFNTLDAVRTRLGASMGRHVDHMRTRANTMRDTGKSLRIDMNKKVERVRYKAYLMRESAGTRMTNFRESSSQTFKSIRSSSGQYAHRVREGMVVRVEAVKYSVKTLKDFCGQTTVQTISVPSVSTNVDSQESEEIFKTITFV